MRRSALPHAKHVVAALASSSPAVKRWEISSSASSGGGVAAEAELTLAANETVSVYTAFADNALSDSNAAGAAAVTAAASLAAATAARSSAGTAAAVADASRQFWSEFWNRSAISLPSSPSVERYWYDARYITGSMAPTDPRLPPPGLFGPWVSKDGPAFGGDYTLDYNYVRAKRPYFVYFVDFWKKRSFAKTGSGQKHKESPSEKRPFRNIDALLLLQEAAFYGVFGSNHPAQAASYFGPIVAYQPVAAKLARYITRRLNLTAAACNASLHYPAGMAPWGLQDIDTHIYMHWK